METMQINGHAPAVAPPPKVKKLRPRKKGARATPAMIRPWAILNEVIAAVSPLMQEVEFSEFKLKPDLGEEAVRKALASVIGDYTVEDAVDLYALVKTRLNSGRAVHLEWCALYEARESLIDFISAGFATNLSDMAARAGFYHECHADLGDVHHHAIRHTNKVDVSHVIDGNFFGGDLFASEWAHRVSDHAEDQDEED